MAAKLLSYPHYVINVDDRSRADDIAVDEDLGLHVPMFFGRYEKGPANKPIYCQSTNDVYRVFGKGFTDIATKYFNRETLFVETCFKKQGAFISRLMPDDAMTASVLLEAHVTTGVDILQYSRNEYGTIIRDEDGNPIPVIDESNQPVKESGVRIKWTSRAINSETESRVKSIKPTTVENGDGTRTTIFPIMAAVAKYAGEFGSHNGFRFYFNIDEQQDDRMSANKALEFSFDPVELSYTDNTPTHIRNTWNQAYTTFMLKPRQYDSKVMQNISYAEVIEDNYKEDSTSELPFDVYFFEEYIRDIGQMVMDVEINDVRLTDPYMVNIFSCVNMDDLPYWHVELDTSEGSIFFNKNYTIYLQGGSDGSLMDEESYQELIRQFLEMKTYPRLKDRFMFPLTHLYDTGYTNTTKEAMITFLGTRDDVRVELSTQDCTNEVNTESEDQSIGLYLRTRALLQVESTIKGTDCCRAAIYAHCGKVYDSRFTGYVPTTLDILDKRCEYQRTPFIKGTPKGRPNSEVTIFKALNWTAFDEDNKALFWDSGINYIQHFNRKGVFWPDLRTVYTSDTSVLSETTFVDAVVYAKHFFAEAWTYYSGSDTPVTELFSAIEKRINDKLHEAFGTRYPFSVKVWRSEQDAKLGFKVRCDIYLTGRTGSRVWEGTIVTLKDETAIGEAA